MIYGLLLILFIIYMPKGILGTLMEWRAKRRSRPSRRKRGAALVKARRRTDFPGAPLSRLGLERLGDDAPAVTWF